jgi:hypothetical protein
MSYDKPFGVARRVWCHIIAGLVSFTIVAPLTFMALDRAEPVTVHSTMFSGDITPGGTVTITWDATATSSCAGTVRRRIIDSDGHTVLSTTNKQRLSVRGELGRKRYSRQFVLPKGIRPARQFTPSSCATLQPAPSMA